MKQKMPQMRHFLFGSKSTEAYQSFCIYQESFSKTGIYSIGAATFTVQPP